MHNALGFMEMSQKNLLFFFFEKEKVVLSLCGLEKLVSMLQ